MPFSHKACVKHHETKVAAHLRDSILSLRAPPYQTESCVTSARIPAVGQFPRACSEGWAEVGGFHMKFCGSRLECVAAPSCTSCSGDSCTLQQSAAQPVNCARILSAVTRKPQCLQCLQACHAAPGAQERKAKQEGDKVRREEARLKKGEGQEDPLPEEPSWDLPAELQVHRSLTHTPPDV